MLIVLYLRSITIIRRTNTMVENETPHERGKKEFKHRLNQIKSHPIDSAMADGYTWCDKKFDAKKDQNACAKGVYDGYVDTLTPEEREKHKKEIEEARKSIENAK